MILEKKNSYFGNIWYQSSQSPPESGGVWRTLADSPPDSTGLWWTLAGLRGPVKIIDRMAWCSGKSLMALCHLDTSREVKCEVK